MPEEEPFLIEFYGTECPHCITMQSLVEKLENELNVKVLRLEVWHNIPNRRKMEEYSEELENACGGTIGVPAFYNSKTGESLCGEIDYETLKEWALKKPEQISYVH